MIPEILQKFQLGNEIFVSASCKRCALWQCGLHIALGRSISLYIDGLGRGPGP